MARRTPVWLLVLILVGGVWTAGVSADQSKPPGEDYYELHKLLVDTLDQVERNYVKDVSRRQLIEAAIQGILSELDPYSSYIPPEQMRRFRTSVESKFGGIGIQISVDGGQLKVLSPLVGTPAYRAGITAGDRIIEIDGEETKDISIDEAVRRLKGEEGTSVSLTVIHPGSAEKHKIDITREVIRIETVLGDARKEDDAWDFMLDHEKHIGYVRVSAFSRNTVRELRQVLGELKEQKLRGLILDLRFNPGGLLNSAIEVSDLFVSKGRIVSTEGRSSPERTWDAHKTGTFEGFPMVVLVNRFSASASEIVSACLQDHKRAVIMGERTWGKGSVQNVIELENHQSALKLTTASYRRPNGKNIHRFSGAKDDEPWGVLPDKGYELKLTDAELAALIYDRRRRDILQPKPPEQAAGEPPPDQPGQEDTGEEPSPEAPSAADPTHGAEAPDEGATPEPEEPNPTPDAQQPTPDPRPEEAVCVDPQLRMALDYLSGELARAD